MLTDRAVRAAKAGEKAARLWDAGGLYLEVSPAGGKLWRFKYRYAKQEKRLALGTYPDVSLADARERRDDARRLLARDVDPGAVKATAKARANGSDSFEVIARDWHERRAERLATAHAERVIRALERDVFPYVGARALDEIDAPTKLKG
jgi:hypothetical protein